MSDERILGNGALHEGWRLLRVTRPNVHAMPGQWYWLENEGGRWLLPVHRDHAEQAWVAGLMPPDWGADALSAGSRVSVTGPEGTALPVETDEPAILLGVGAGIGPILAAAERLMPPPSLVILDGSRGLPSRVCPSRFMVSAVPMEAIAGLASLERRGIASRIAVPAGRAGCFEGSAVDLLRHHLTELPESRRGTLPLIAVTPWDTLARWRRSLAETLAGVTVAILPAPPRRSAGRSEH